MEWFFFAVIGIFAYCIGSISTAILVGKILAGDDIRSHGSGNAGATNALRTYGKKAAVMVVLGDGLKAVVAILAGLLISALTSIPSALTVYIASVGVALGHNFPLFFHFRGGKGVLVSAVSMLFFDWRIGLTVLVVSILTMAITRYVSLGSVLGAVLFFVLGLIFHVGDGAYILFAGILAGLLIARHRLNIKRLLHGEENKLGQKKQ